jgi:hypothetical protein
VQAKHLADLESMQVLSRPLHQPLVHALENVFEVAPHSRRLGKHRIQVGRIFPQHTRDVRDVPRALVVRRDDPRPHGRLPELIRAHDLPHLPRVKLQVLEPPQKFPLRHPLAPALLPLQPLPPLRQQQHLRRTCPPPPPPQPPLQLCVAHLIWETGNRHPRLLSRKKKLTGRPTTDGT